MGPLMINMAFMPLHMWEMRDVTPVTDTRTVESNAVFCLSRIRTKSRIWLIIRSILRESWAQLCEKHKNTFEEEKSDVRREICRQKGFQSFFCFQESSIFCIHKWIEESPTSSQEMEKCLPFIFVLNQDILEIKKKFSFIYLSEKDIFHVPFETGLVILTKSQGTQIIWFSPQNHGKNQHQHQYQDQNQLRHQHQQSTINSNMNISNSNDKNKSTRSHLDLHVCRSKGKSI